MIKDRPPRGGRFVWRQRAIQLRRENDHVVRRTACAECLLTTPIPWKLPNTPPENGMSRSINSPQFVAGQAHLPFFLCALGVRR